MIRDQSPDLGDLHVLLLLLGSNGGHIPVLYDSDDGETTGIIRMCNGFNYSTPTILGWLVGRIGRGDLKFQCCVSFAVVRFGSEIISSVFY